jgi:hypothetical protein
MNDRYAAAQEPVIVVGAGPAGCPSRGFKYRYCDPAELYDAVTELAASRPDDEDALEQTLAAFMTRHLGPGMAVDAALIGDGSSAASPETSACERRTTRARYVACSTSPAASVRLAGASSTACRSGGSRNCYRR